MLIKIPPYQILSGQYASRVRCFSLQLPQASQSHALHFESQRQLISLAELKDTAEQNQSQSEGPVALFTHQGHLPPDLLGQIESIEGFSAFGRVIVFAPQIYELYLSTSYGTLPASMSDAPKATSVSGAGFPVTSPTEIVVHSCSFSFGDLELKDFLGERFFNYAGRMLFLNLSVATIPEHFVETVGIFIGILSEQVLSIN